MKKTLMSILTLLLVFSLFGCKEKSEYEELYEKDEDSFLEENAVRYGTLEEANEAIGVNLVIPEIMGKAKETYSIVDDKIAQYKCLLAGVEFSLRGAKTSLTSDISGILINEKAPFTSSTEEEYAEDQTYKAVRFIINDNQYVVIAKDEAKMDKETFNVIVEQIKEAINNETSNNTSNGIEGTYMDEVSQRATAEVSTGEDSNLVLKVEWPSSASELDRWTLTINNNNETIEILSGQHEKVNYDEEGNETSTENISEENFGAIEYKEGKIYWTTSINDEETNLIFSKTN